MTELDVPAPRTRTRPAPSQEVLLAPAPRARVRAVPHEETTGEVLISPRPRERPVVERVVIKDALPLRTMARTHNGYVPKGSEQPDIRFAPLIIIMRPEWAKRLPDYIRMVVDEMLSWTPETAWPTAKLDAHGYLYETALRRYIGKRLLPNDTYAMLRDHIVANHAELNDVQRSMIDKTTGDADLTTASGPFYLDSVLAVEIHYAKLLADVQPVAS